MSRGRNRKNAQSQADALTTVVASTVSEEPNSSVSMSNARKQGAAGRRKVRGGYPAGRSVADPAVRERSRSGASRTLQTLAKAPFFPLGKPDWSEADVQTVKLNNGQTLGTYYSRDPFRTQKPELVIMPYSNINLGTFQPGGVGVADTAANIAGTRFTNAIQQIMNVINFNGRFTPNQVIAAAADWVTYVNNYIIAFSILWAYLCATEGIGVNASTRAIATGLAANGLLDRVSIDWRRLQVLPIPPGIPKLCAEMFGMFAGDDEDWVYLTYIDTVANATTVTDWTSTANAATAITGLVTQAETALSNCEVLTAEAALLNQVLAMVYGVPEPLPTPLVWHDPILFDQHFHRATQFLVVTIFSQPQKTSTGPGGTIPILVRKGMESNPYVNRLFTYFRPGFFDAAAVNGSLGAAGSQVGMVTNGAGVQDFSRVYGPGIAAAGAIFTDGSFAALNYGNGTFLEVEWWSSFTQSTSGVVNWTADARSYDRWDIYYPNDGLLSSNTVKFIDDLLYSGMRIRELR